MLFRTRDVILSDTNNKVGRAYEFFDNCFYGVYDVSRCQTEGHWLVAFQGTKAEVREAYDDIVDPDMEDEDEFEYCFKNRFPDFVHDFEKTKQLFVKNVRKGREWMYEWTPCEWEDCQESDTVLLRAHSLAPCDIVRMEEDALFFDLVDNTDSSSHIIGAYFIWPLDPKLNGYLRYLHQDYKNPGCWIPCAYSVVLDRREGQIPPVIIKHAEFSSDVYDKTFKSRCGNRISRSGNAGTRSEGMNDNLPALLRDRKQRRSLCPWKSTNKTA